LFNLKKIPTMEDEIDITQWPEHFLVKMKFKEGYVSNILPGNKRKFRLGCPVVIGQPIKRTRIKKSTLGCHVPKVKYDPMTTNVLKFEELDGGTLIETTTSIYMLFPV